MLVMPVMVSSCTPMNSQGGWNGFTPKPLHMKGIPDGDSSFDQGFRDACGQAVGTMGTGLLRANSGWQYDVNRALKDEEYYKGFRGGSTYCTYFMDTDPL